VVAPETEHRMDLLLEFLLGLEERRRAISATSGRYSSSPPLPGPLPGPLFALSDHLTIGGAVERPGPIGRSTL
jgi:hypothetical protein